MSIDRGMDKEDVVHIYNGLLLSHKKEWNNAICNNMDGPGDYHTKWSKSNRERQISHDITYMWNLIFLNDTNEFIYKTETDLQISKKNLWLPKGKCMSEGSRGYWWCALYRNAVVYGLVTFIGKVSLNCIGGNLWLLWKSVWVFWALAQQCWCQEECAVSIIP